MNDDFPVELTAEEGAERLKETEIRGRKVYVSERNETAFVDTEHGLVSLKNLRSWNYLLEEAKKDVIEDYDEEKSVEEKRIEKKRKGSIRDIERTQKEVMRSLQNLRSRFSEEDY